MEQIENYIKTIPLYHSLYGEKIKNFKFKDRLKEYPLLLRSHIINDFPNNWMTSKLRNALNLDEIEKTTTSGTSGHRIQIFRKKNWWKDEYIRTYRYSDYLKNFHVDVGKKAILTTAICSNATCYLDFPSYRERIIYNTLYLNISTDPNNWGKADIERMIIELNDFQPEYIDADPIYLALFLQKIESLGIKIKLHLPKMITLSYELVTSYTKRYIQNRLNIPVINLYGTTELGYIYIEQNGRQIRCSDLSYVEFIPFAEKKGIYHLIVSSTKNEYMPFVRFKMGDLVKINLQHKFSQLLDDTQIEYICGREKDVVFNNNDEPITPGEIDHLLSKLENNILLYQIQIKNRIIIFRYMTLDYNQITVTIQEQISEILVELFGQTYQIKFRLERSIAPEVSGKFLNIKKI